MPCVYRLSPSKKNMLTHSQFFEQFQNFLEHCDALPGKTLIVGDFNIHVDDVNDPYSKRLFTLLDMFCFSQSVVGSTHKHGHTLDLILFRSSDDIVSSSFINNDLKSDHSAVMCRLNIPKPIPESHIIMYRRINKIDKQVFRDDLSMSVSLNCSVAKYRASWQSVLDRHAPLRQRTLRPRKFNPWFSNIAGQISILT